MNKLIIYQYINKLRREDIVNYCNMKEIIINNNDIDTIYSYIKNDYKRFFNNPNEILDEIRYKISNYSYNELIKLYDKYKYMIK